MKWNPASLLLETTFHDRVRLARAASLNLARLSSFVSGVAGPSSDTSDAVEECVEEDPGRNRARGDSVGGINRDDRKGEAAVAAGGVLRSPSNKARRAGEGTTGRGLDLIIDTGGGEGMMRGREREKSLRTAGEVDRA